MTGILRAECGEVRHQGRVRQCRDAQRGSRPPTAGAIPATGQDRPRGDPRRRGRAVHQLGLRQHVDPAHRRCGRRPAGVAVSPLRHQGRHPRRAADRHRRRTAARWPVSCWPKPARPHRDCTLLVVSDVDQLCASRWNLGALYLLPELRVDRFEQFRLRRDELRDALPHAGAAGHRRMRRSRRCRRSAVPARRIRHQPPLRRRRLPTGAAMGDRRRGVAHTGLSTATSPRYGRGTADRLGIAGVNVSA